MPRQIHCRTLPRLLLAAGALAATTAPLLASTALAQSAPPIGVDQRGAPPPSDYDPRAGSYDPPESRDQRDYDSGRDDPDADNYTPPPEPAPPPGYDGTRLPPPPEGYQAYPDERSDADDRYAADAERWARDNCVKSQGNIAGGAVFGGLLGAIIGSSVAGRHDRGAGAFAGAAIGAVGGAAVASSSGGNATSPGCPPGFVVRRGAVAYSYGGPDYAYAAPGWYRPWVFIDGAWIYRPYPYHGWYYRHHYSRDGRERYHYRNGAPRGDWRGREDWRDHGGWNRRGY